MSLFLDIFETGLSIGATYAVLAIALSFVWNSIGMLNMAQGAMLTVGGYASYCAIQYLSLPWWAGLPVAIAVGVLGGLIIFFVTVKWMYRSTSFDTNIVVATVGIATVVENIIVRVFSGYAKKQPFYIDGFIAVGGAHIRLQTLLNVAVAIIVLCSLQLSLSRTRMGTAIKAVSQDRYAAQLLGIPLYTNIRPGARDIERSRRTLGRSRDGRTFLSTLCWRRASAESLYHLRHRRLGPNTGRLRHGISAWLVRGFDKLYTRNKIWLSINASTCDHDSSLAAPWPVRSSKDSSRMNTPDNSSPERSRAIQREWQAVRWTETKIDLSFGLLILAVGLLLPFADPGRYVLGQITLFFIWAESSHSGISYLASPVSFRWRRWRCFSLAATLLRCSVFTSPFPCGSAYPWVV